MAEARRAVGFSVDLYGDEVKGNINVRALKTIFFSTLRDWRYSYQRMKNKFYNGMYPARPGHVVSIVMGVFASSLAGLDLSFGVIGHLEKLCELKLGLAYPRNHQFASLVFSLTIWSGWAVIRRLILRAMYSYMGWIYEVRGKRSFKTMCWAVLVRLVKGGNPTIYSYQKSLPSLPVPRLSETIRRYLKSLEPLLSPKEMEEMKSLATTFRRKHGCKIQFFLTLKYFWAVNYVTDWWEDYIYLSSRSSLMVNSNFYGLDAIMMNFQWRQSARAANFVWSLLQVMNDLKNETLAPLILQDMIPLCSSQYERAFCTTRVPCLKKDKILHYADSTFIVVMHTGNYYQVFFKHRGRQLSPVDLEEQFTAILEDKSNASKDELYLASLTASDRDHWARTRMKFFSDGANRTSLSIIEKAAFVLVLDDEAHNYDQKDPTILNAMARSALHGKGYDRWFDKSFNIIIWKNGKLGLNIEHAWADAPVMSHIAEISMIEDALSPSLGYSPDCHCRGIPASDNPTPKKLYWSISDGLHNAIEEAMQQSQKIVKNVDLHLLRFEEFGKEEIKKIRVSPDSFIQMALQLAYFKNMKNFALTYEASMTRLYRNGRTETVRSCTVESSAFVKLMMDSKSSKEERIKAFRIATENHQKLYRDAMVGKGVDRHIFCMFVISKYLGIESEFLHKALMQPWKLSTSQTPHSQTQKVDSTKHPEFLSAGGGFGPVADDGYGVSYIIAGEKTIFFHVSSQLSCPLTSSVALANDIAFSMTSIRALFCP